MTTNITRELDKAAARKIRDANITRAAALIRERTGFSWEYSCQFAEREWTRLERANA